MTKRMATSSRRAPATTETPELPRHFAALVADRKLKPGGMLALVLPLSVASGLAWKWIPADAWNQDYTDLTVLSIAANGK